MNIRDAMGTRDGDYLEISNAWGRAVIAREHSPLGALPEGRVQYYIGGDVVPKAEQGPHRKLEDAVAIALRHLALYQAGRCD
jgi:hypothetical protein